MESIQNILNNFIFIIISLHSFKIMDLWSIFVYFIVLFLLIDLLATVLDLFNLIDKNKPIINFSILKNFVSIFPKQKTNISSKNGFKDPNVLFAGIRVLCQIYILFIHWNTLILLVYRHTTIIHVISSFAAAKYFGTSVLRLTFVIFFLFSGIASGKWFFRHFQTNRFESNLRLILRFFLERYLMIGPFYYIFLFSYLFYVKYLVTETISDKNVEKICSDAIIPNMLFIKTFYDSTDPVIDCMIILKVLKSYLLQCLGHNWTYPVLIQLVAITPIFVYAFKR